MGSYRYDQRDPKNGHHTQQFFANAAKTTAAASPAYPNTHAASAAAKTPDQRQSDPA